MSLTSRARRWGLATVAVGGAALSLWWVTTEPRRSERQAIQRGRDDILRGRPDLALRTADQVIRSGSKSADALTVKGLALASLDRPEDAQEILKRSLAIRPNQPIALKVLAATYFNSSDVELGIAALREAAKFDPADYRPWFALGDAYDQLNQPGEAASSYRQALLRKPDDGETRLRLVAALLETNEADAATLLLDELLRDRPGDPQIAYLDAQRAWALGRSDDAARSIERALAIAPDHCDALILRSKLCQLNGRLDGALADAERAAALNRSDLEILNQLCLLEAALGLKDRAATTSARRQRVTEIRTRMQELTKETQARPDDPGPRWRLGRAAAELGAAPLALRCYRAALHLDPRCQPALLGLAELGAPRWPVPSRAP